MARGTLRRLIKRPYSFPSAMQTTNDGTIINGGALLAGAPRSFPQADFQNDFTWPVWIQKVRLFINRQAGGETTDSDWENVFLQITDLVTQQALSKNFISLAVLVDRNSRVWDLRAAGEEWVLRTQGGGAIIRLQVNNGALGAPYNVEINLEGYAEIESEIPDSWLPDQQ